jgi:CBS domain-containing protein
VVEEDGRLRGIVSKTDIVRHLTEGLDVTASEALNDVSVGDIMTEDVVTVSADEAVSKVARIMAENRLHRVVVVDAEHKIRGILTTFDILRMIV